MKYMPADREIGTTGKTRTANAVWLSIGLALACLLFVASVAKASETILVEVDRAQLLRLDEPAGSVIIGNPVIADAAIQDQRMLIITGKSFGSTNLIVLDGEGNEILSKTLEVRVGSNSVVTMHRGAARYSYSCSPVCEPTLQSGDNKEYFDAVRDQTMSRIDTAYGQAGGR